MTDLNNASDLEELYGPLYPYSDHKRGDVITFTDSEHGTLSGTILWVVGPGPIASTDMPAHYIVDANGSFPDTVFPSDVIADCDEPTLTKCPYCSQYHEVGKVEQCPLKPTI